jgi:hypothetical protein
MCVAYASHPEGVNINSATGLTIVDLTMQMNKQLRYPVDVLLARHR